MFYGKKMIAKLLSAFLGVTILLPSTVNAATYDELVEIKETSHSIAQQARSIGLPETNEIIVEAKALWHEADQKIQRKEYDQPIATTYYVEEDVELLSKVAFCEARGIQSKTEIACIMWTILNRHDNGYGSIRDIITAPNQFAYYSSAPTISDYGYDLRALAQDVLDRWNQERNGAKEVGRVLPKDYLWYSGDGTRNYFRNQYRSGSNWNYSLESPYEN